MCASALPFLIDPKLTCRLLVSDNSGFISYDEFKNVFSANIGTGAIPFDFDWLVEPLRDGFQDIDLVS